MQDREVGWELGATGLLATTFEAAQGTGRVRTLSSLDTTPVSSAPSITGEAKPSRFCRAWGWIRRTWNGGGGGV
jgi:hypothetical protein